MAKYWQEKSISSERSVETKMRKSKVVAAPVLALALLVALPAYAGKFNSIVEIGAPMPEFVGLPSTDGKTLSSADLKENTVVLVFLANHCPWVKGSERD